MWIGLDANAQARLRLNDAADANGGRRNVDDEWLRLHGELDDWRAWVETMENDGAAPPESVAGWRRLEAKLATLLDCVRVVHGERMSDALLHEAAPIAARMRRERWRSRGRRRPSMPTRQAA